MKYFYFIVLLFVICILAGCENEVLCESHNTTELLDYSSNLNESEAQKLANSFFTQELIKTRNISLSNPTCECVTDFIPTRNSESVKDTLAYIFNYSKENGFVIVAANKNIAPILAFSQEGTFDLNNELAKENFLSRIKDYLINYLCSITHINSFKKIQIRGYQDVMV